MVLRISLRFGASRLIAIDQTLIGCRTTSGRRELAVTLRILIHIQRNIQFLFQYSGTTRHIRTDTDFQCTHAREFVMQKWRGNSMYRTRIGPSGNELGCSLCARFAGSPQCVSTESTTSFHLMDQQQSYVWCSCMVVLQYTFIFFVFNLIVTFLQKSIRINRSCGSLSCNSGGCKGEKGRVASHIVERPGANDFTFPMVIFRTRVNFLF